MVICFTFVVKDVRKHRRHIFPNDAGKYDFSDHQIHHQNDQMCLRPFKCKGNGMKEGEAENAYNKCKFVNLTSVL